MDDDKNDNSYNYYNDESDNYQNFNKSIKSIIKNKKNQFNENLDYGEFDEEDNSSNSINSSNSDFNSNSFINSDNEYKYFQNKKKFHIKNDDQNIEKNLNENIKFLEKRYIDLAKDIENQNDYLNKILDTKHKELDSINDYNKIFTDHSIKGCNLENLYSLRGKISEMLSEISLNKERILNESKNEYLLKTMVNNMCVICYENLATILFKPCNHLSVCMRCGIGLDTCSVCRIALLY